VLSIVSNGNNFNYNQFHAYLVTSAGVSGPFVTPDARNHATIGQMKFSSACRPSLTGNLVDLTIANTSIYTGPSASGSTVTSSTPSTTAVFLYQFNIQTGQVITNTNPSVIPTTAITNPNARFYGTEFSPGGRYLYAATFGYTGASQLFRYDILTNTVISLPSFDPSTPAKAMQVGTDGKIYITRPSPSSTLPLRGFLDVIETPDGTTTTITPYSPWTDAVEPSGSIPNFYVTPNACPCDAFMAYHQNGDTTISVSTTWTAGSNPWSSTTIPKINGNIIIAPGRP
jgi:hypothetical protein